MDDGFSFTESSHARRIVEFRSHGGFAAGPTIDLIADSKRPPSRIAASAKGHAVQYFEDRATMTIARALRGQFGQVAIESQITFVPVPPSKLPGETDHCDRLLRTLRLALAGLCADIRPLAVLDVLTSGKHLSVAKARIREMSPDPAIVARRVGVERQPPGPRRASPGGAA